MPLPHPPETLQGLDGLQTTGVIIDDPINKTIEVVSLSRVLDHKETVNDLMALLGMTTEEAWNVVNSILNNRIKNLKFIYSHDETQDS